MSGELLDLLHTCKSLPDGFLGLDGESAWRLGTVLMVQSQAAFVVVRKANAEGGQYEFGNLVTLPGGMVRERDRLVEGGEIKIERLMLLSLANRVLRETSLILKDMPPLVLADLGPIVTSYFAKGKQRFALLVAHTCEMPEQVPLCPDDHSILEATWMPFAADWSSFAPANCVAIAHLVWSKLGPQDQKAAYPYIIRAIDRCKAWGVAVGFPCLPTPWAEGKVLDKWQGSWDFKKN